MTITAHSDDIKITPLKAPLFPYHLGNARIAYNKHTFVHYVELKPIIEQVSNIQHFYNTIASTLNKTHSDKPAFSHYNSLSNLLNHVRYLILEVKDKLNNILPHSRSKRGLLNFVGVASKWLFGTLDSDDAEKYDNAISELQNKQNSFVREVTMQISLTKRLIDNYNATITLLSTNQNLIKQRLEYFEHNMNKTIENIGAFLRAENTLDQIILNCQNLITFLNNLENAIAFAKLNILHTSVISASELELMIAYLTKVYNEDHVAQFKNLISYYQVAGTQVIYLSNKIMFAIHLPILLKEKFEKYHLFPIPFNNTAIIPSHPYLVLGTDHLQYENERCPSIEDIYICQHKLETKINDCAAALIHEANSKNCHLTPTKVTATILEAINSQHIIAIPSGKPLKLQKICNDNGHFWIENPNLIEIPFNCGAKIENQVYWNKEDLTLGRPFTLPEITINNENFGEIQNKPLNLNTVDLEKIHHFQKEAGILETNEIYNIHPMVWSSSTTIIILIVLGIITCIAWIIHRRRKTRLIENQTENEDPTLENKRNPLFSF